MRVLLVDDDASFRRIFGGALRHEGFRVETAEHGIAGLEQMNRRAFDLALVDLRMPQMDGLELLSEMRRRHPNVVPVVLTGHGTIPTAVEATRSGAFDVLSKSAPIEQVIDVLHRAARERRATRREPRLEQAVFEQESFFGIVGKSAAMRAAFHAIERFQTSDRPVLVTGETGTGKELVARALHAGGPRRDRPLVAVNCASLRDNFVDNELFGHVRGAFTGAQTDKPGLFAVADGGSLHIDEIGRMPESSQATILRVLDTGCYRPLGATAERSANVRVIASTNDDLDAMVASERFRSDLLYRLGVCRVHLPPLRERREDIPLLVNHFLDTSPAAQRQRPHITPRALDALMDHDWPGNVRELFGCLDQAVLLADDALVEPAHLRLRPGAAPPRSMDGDARGEVTLAEIEQHHIAMVLERQGGNVTAAARALGIDPTTLRRKLRRWTRHGSG